MTSGRKDLTNAKTNVPELTVPGDRIGLHPQLVWDHRRADGVPAEGVSAIPTAIVDRDEFFLTGVVHVIADWGCEVVTYCPSLNELSPQILKSCRLLIVGLDRERREILRQFSDLRRQYPHLRVMVFDQSATADLTEIISAGVDCYLLKKELTPLLLVKAIELVLLGSVILSNHLARDAGSAPGNVARPSGRKNSVIPEPSIMHLSNKERGILLSLIDGCSNKQIAREHGITEATVKVHVKNLFIKIGVINRTQAAIWGIDYLNKTNTCADSSVCLDPVQDLSFLTK